jgi:hypothetical protein
MISTVSVDAETNWRCESSSGTGTPETQQNGRSTPGSIPSRKWCLLREALTAYTVAGCVVAFRLKKRTWLIMAETTAGL